MNNNRISFARSVRRDARERITKRLDDLSRREGWYDNSEKIAFMRKVMFADVDELQKSGRIKLPK